MGTLSFNSLENKVELMREDLSAVKSDVRFVRSKCEEIDRRCNQLEENSQKCFSLLDGTAADVNELFVEVEDGKKEIGRLRETVKNTTEEMTRLKEEMDRLESFSRRDNLRMFGVPAPEGKEDYNSCAKAVTEALNSVTEASRTWTTDDIARAHRVGQSREGGPRPMIIKFYRWKDKMAIITDKDFRSKLKEKGITVANDLTRQQASVVAEARKQGKVAFFKNGKLTVQPRQPDSRTYAEIADPDSKQQSAKQATPSQTESSTEVNGNRSLLCTADYPPCHQSTSQSGSSPRSPHAGQDSRVLRHQSTSQQSNSQRSPPTRRESTGQCHQSTSRPDSSQGLPRERRESMGPGQRGVHDFFTCPQRQGYSKTSKVPGGKTLGKSFPRRSDRNVKKV